MKRVVSGIMYLDVEIFVNPDRFTKHEDVLHDRGKFPHVSYFGKHGRLLFPLRRFGSLHLLMGALARHGREGIRARRQRRRDNLRLEGDPLPEARMRCLRVVKGGSGKKKSLVPLDRDIPFA